MTNRIEEKKETNTPLEINGVFEVEKEEIKRGVEDALNREKIVIDEEEIEKILKEKRVFQRIILLRHYPYNEESEENRKMIKEYNGLKDKKIKGEKVNNERLSYLENIVDNLSYKTYDEVKDERIREIIKVLFLKKDKLLFLYSNTGKKRVKNTGEDLIKVFSLNNIEYINLEGSDKSLPLGDIYIDKSSEFKEQYNKIKNNKENKKYETIVIVGNRTYSYGMNFVGGNGNITIIESEKDFENNGYIIHEYNEKGEILRNTGDIFMTPENYEDFQKIFNIEHTSIIDFQNKLNVYFFKNPELIKRYVKSEIEELRKYCLIKLIENKESETLNEIFKDEKFREKIKGEEYENIDKRLYNILQYYFEVYPQVLLVRKKSLDDRINDGKNIEPDFNFDREEYNELLELIHTGKPIKYIEGKAGAGKSFLLSHIAEKLNEENLNENRVNPYEIIYINLSGEGLYKFTAVNTNGEKIYLIDSIDESKISGIERKELDKILLRLSQKGKVIITARSGYLYDYNGEENILESCQENIEIEDFDVKNIDKYLDKYFVGDKEKIEESKKILSKLKGAGNNPLILSMIGDIVNKGGLDEQDLEKITILNIYEAIVKMRLKYWNHDVYQRDVNTKNNSLESLEIKRVKALKKKIFKLSIIGYKQLFKGEKFTIFDINDFIDDESIDIESFNLLFRKNENGEYDFVHQSIKEYFAAKYLFDEMRYISQKAHESLKISCKVIMEQDIYDFFQRIGKNMPNSTTYSQVSGFEEYDYEILEKLLHFIKNDEYITTQIVNIVFSKAERGVGLIGKEMLMLSILNPKIAKKVFDSCIVNYKTSYKDLDFIEGIVRSKVKGYASYVKMLLLNIILNLKKTKSNQDRNCYYFHKIVALMLSNGGGHLLKQFLYNHIIASENILLLTKEIFKLLYNFSEDKISLLAEIKTVLEKYPNSKAYKDFILFRP